MNDLALIAALGAVVLASAAFFFLGRRAGASAGRRIERRLNQACGRFGSEGSRDGVSTLFNHIGRFR